MSIFITIFFVSIAHAANYNDDHAFEIPDRSNWIDPNDPISRKFKSVDDGIARKLLEENQRLKSRIEELELAQSGLVPVASDRSAPDRKSSIDETEIAIFKHFLRKLATKFPSPGTYSADIRIYQQVLLTWNEFLLSSSSSPIESKFLQNVAGSILDLFERVKRESVASTKSGFIGAISDFVQSYLPLVNFCLLVPAAALLLVRLLRVSRWQLTLWILFLVFFISVIWTWIHLYKERQAEMQARFVRHARNRGGVGAGEFCKADRVSAWKALKDYVGGWFSFKPDDPCIEYHKDVMIDPIWTVTPLEAVSVAITKFFVRPLAPLGDGISRFWRALLIDMPFTYYAVIFPAMSAGVAFLVLVLCGYRLRLGFGLLSLEPYGHRVERRLSALPAPTRESREISTQTLPAVTWTGARPNAECGTNQVDVGQKGHVRRCSASGL